MPTLQDSPQPKAAIQLRADHFTPDDFLDIAEAGGVFAAAIADIAHHEISEPGCWDCYGSPPDELARLRDALDGMQKAIQDARAQLSAVERRARRRAAARQGGRGRSSGQGNRA